MAGRRLQPQPPFFGGPLARAGKVPVFAAILNGSSRIVFEGRRFGLLAGEWKRVCPRFVSFLVLSPRLKF